MANHSTEKDNYVENKTWDEAFSGKPGKVDQEAVAEDAKKRVTDKGAAAKNGGGDK